MARADHLNWILRYLRQLASVGVRELGENEEYSLGISIEDGGEQRFEVRSFTTLSQEKARDLVETSRSRSFGVRLLLAVPELAPRTRELLRNERMSWIERDTGVCHIVAPGLYIDTRVSGSAARLPSPTPTRLRDRTGLVAEALLQASPRHTIRLSAISKNANVSAALVSRVFQRLTALGLLQEHGAGPRRFWSLTDFGGLLELWSKEEREPETVTSLYVWSRSVNALYEKLPKIHDLRARWAVAGTAAAYLYAPVLTAAPSPIVYLDAAVPAQDLAKVLGGEVVDKGGNIQVWQSKGNPALYRIQAYEPAAGAIVTVGAGRGSLELVSKPRAYIETIRAAGRSPEVANALREQMLRDGHD
ncbi:hypothetical protein [Granulicella rosea]|uniref:hypothetical protein n=1 Tax=Granulicella rosea TaxID=474952 RepID=UPI000B781578|nr:hypothetical protein [Granulicella rosea]